MAPAGLATITMATSAATSASRSLLIELPPNRARRDGAAPARGPRCPVPLPRAVAGVCAYRAGCVDSGRKCLPGSLDSLDSSVEKARRPLDYYVETSLRWSVGGHFPGHSLRRQTTEQNRITRTTH